MRPGRPAGAYTQAARVRRVESLLWSRERVSLVDIAADLGVTPRTVRRDLAVVREVYALRRHGAHVSIAGEVSRG